MAKSISRSGIKQQRRKQNLKLYPATPQRCPIIDGSALDDYCPTAFKPQFKMHTIFREENPSIIPAGFVPR
ncbi:unnamed protein product [Cercopithifilaria johnstoni]|uniref:Uncharacterized protein n=1 Tax=Cercopithifilaria johnstoni TaxID=2874296 RepID=A0A8J2Q715_9BILA|nr:unnamed protein product [Cercopithifilaria johnstoni]